MEIEHADFVRGGEVFVEALRNRPERFRRHLRAAFEVAAYHLHGNYAKRHRRNEHQKEDNLALCKAHIRQKRERADNLNGLTNHLRGERKQDCLHRLSVGCKTHEEVARRVLVEERKRIVLHAREQVLLDSAQHVERNVAHQIPAQIPRYRAYYKYQRNEHRHAENIPQAIRHAVFGHENALQNLVENDGHTEAARRAEEQPRQQRPNQIPELGLYI